MKFVGLVFGLLSALFVVSAASAEVTEAELLEMVKQQRYVFHVDRPTNPPREIDAVFDLNGFHLIDQTQVIFSRRWIKIERVSIEGNLILTHFTDGPEFAVPRADLKYEGVEDQFRFFALDQIVKARLPKE